MNYFVTTINRHGTLCLRENYLPVEYRLSETTGITTLEITQASLTQEQADHSAENWKMAINGMKELIENNKQ
jgi:hypothetical protein